jgi:hypothetical protein
MTIHFVYGILPAFITYTDDVGAEDRGAVTNGIRIRIRPKYRDDMGILEHELEHVRQCYRFWEGMSHLDREVAAYRLQLTCYPDTPDEHQWRKQLFATFLSSGYPDFVISADDALLRLND